MPKSTFDTEQEADDYKREHQLLQRVAVPLIGRGKWALIFPIEAHITVNDGAPDGMREPSGNLSNYIEPSAMSAEAKSSLVDGEVLGQDADGGLIHWNATAGAPYNSGQTVKEFGISNLSDAELKRLKLSNYIEHSDPTLFAKYAGPRALDETSIGDIPLHEQQAYWASLGESGEMTEDDANRLYAAWHAAQVSFSGLSAPLEQREVSNYTDPNEFLLSEYSKYAERIAEGDPMEFDDWLAGSDLPEIVKAREIAKVQERNLSNYIEHPASGKTGTFTAKYDQHAERNGQTFTVLGAVDPKTYDATECGEMFSIRFADGVQIDAWPEEVESAMNEARLVNIDEEVVVKLADGCTLRSGVYDPHKEGALTSGEYVRLCDPDGEEILYWDQEEWANDPALVMGAIMNAAAGLRVHHVDSPSPGM